MAALSNNPSGRDRPAQRDSETHRQKLETVGRLASGVAHDFANLVTLITGYSEMLLARMDPRDPQRGEVEEIRKAADRGARLTSQLLDFTRNDSVHPQAVDLNHVISDMERMLRDIIGDNVELRTECAPDLAQVAVDPGQIEQVIVNLILNARDAMPAGGAIVVRTMNVELSPEIAARQGMPAGFCVLLIVADTGYGMGPTTLERVFEPFFTTKARGRGTGLGLSTVQNIVRQSGGAVWVSSEVGEGATFTVCLPRVDSAQGTDHSARPAKSHSGNETILLVEDDTGVRQLLARILQGRGYQVLEACSAEEALEIFGRAGKAIHLVLTDVMMPGMNGLDLARHLCAEHPGLRILCMSGYTEEVLEHNKSFSPGMPFLRKPLRPDALAAGVREALDSPGQPFNPR